ncbi:hypothetical protein EDC01DRAFT_630649 [Geopyxis carbonaria]|nr:hypothetical protein EDC01DRAFT_630649 [Geopyxis carbonaria]
MGAQFNNLNSVDNMNVDSDHGNDACDQVIEYYLRQLDIANLIHVLCVQWEAHSGVLKKSQAANHNDDHVRRYRSASPSSDKQALADSLPRSKDKYRARNSVEPTSNRTTNLQSGLQVTDVVKNSAPVEEDKRCMCRKCRSMRIYQELKAASERAKNHKARLRLRSDSTDTNIAPNSPDVPCKWKGCPQIRHMMSLPDEEEEEAVPEKSLWEKLQNDELRAPPPKPRLPSTLRYEVGDEFDESDDEENSDGDDSDHDEDSDRDEDGENDGYSEEERYKEFALLDEDQYHDR